MTYLVPAKQYLYLQEHVRVCDSSIETVGADIDVYSVCYILQHGTEST